MYLSFNIAKINIYTVMTLFDAFVYYTIVFTTYAMINISYADKSVVTVARPCFVYRTLITQLIDTETHTHISYCALTCFFL